MREFSYVINDENGIHARPAGALVKQAEKYQANITINIDGKAIDAKRLFGVMGLGVKKGESVLITFDGVDEDEAIAEIEKYMIENL